MVENFKTPNMILNGEQLTLVDLKGNIHSFETSEKGIAILTFINNFYSVCNEQEKGFFDKVNALYTTENNKYMDWSTNDSAKQEGFDYIKFVMRMSIANPNMFNITNVFMEKLMLELV